MPSIRMCSVAGSRIVSLNDEIERLKQRGEDIISFTLGEPDFDTPKVIIDETVEAMRAGFTHYTASLGIVPLREVVAGIYSKRNRIPCTMENVLVAPAKMAIFDALLSLFDEGEEILIPDPAWVSYEQMTRLIEATPVRYNLREDFHLDLDEINEIITPKTKGIIINTPSNPTGAVLTLDEIKGLADFAVDNDLLVISDEVYERIVFEGRHISIASLPEMFERTITVFSCSKTYAMSGWRVGWTIAPDDIMVELGKVHQNVITCAPSFIQVGALAALLKGEEALNGMVETYRMRRDYVAAALNDIPGIHCKPPEGTFYAFPTFDLDMDSFDFAAFLLKEARVAVTPGGAFGENACRHFRLSFATSMENLREGIARIREAMERVV